ncbi:hypothetical protein BOX15_Mlig009907g1, partial [Macrostomum lignano]
RILETHMDTKEHAGTEMPPPEAPSTEPVAVQPANQQPLSKRAQKRLKKRELVKALRKAKRQQLKASGQKPQRHSKRLTKAAANSMSDSSCRIRVVIDCSFDSLMPIGDICKLFNQLQHCYGYNRRSEAPMQLYVTDLNGKLLDKLKSIGTADYLNWDINWREESYLSLFPRDEIVYLCSESETVLDQLSDNCVYVIGGLVDHNHYPGHCFELAKQLGLRTAKLPISQHIKLNSRQVLTVDQVFHLLLKYSSCRDWAQTLQAVVPKRKIVELKDGKGETSGGAVVGENTAVDGDDAGDEADEQDETDDQDEADD